MYHVEVMCETTQVVKLEPAAASVLHPGCTEGTSTANKKKSGRRPPNVRGVEEFSQAQLKLPFFKKVLICKWWIFKCYIMFCWSQHVFVKTSLANYGVKVQILNESCLLPSCRDIANYYADVNENCRICCLEGLADAGPGVQFKRKLDEGSSQSQCAAKHERRCCLAGHVRLSTTFRLHYKLQILHIHTWVPLYIVIHRYNMCLCVCLGGTAIQINN